MISLWQYRWIRTGLNVATLLLAGVLGSPSLAAEHTTPPTWSWQLGTSSYDQVSGIAAAFGEVYVAGYTKGQLGVEVPAGGFDFFVAKLREDGTLQWLRQRGTPANEYALGVALDDRDPKAVVAYVAGYTTGGLDGNTNVGNGTSDLFLVKYDANGTRQWTRQLGTTLGDFAQAVSTGPDGSVYVTGYTFGGLDGNTNAGNGTSDLFLVKYDANGTRQWTRQLGTAANDQGRGVAVDTNGSVYVTGYTFGGLDGNTNAGNGNSDLFLVKYDANGTRQWTRQLGTNGTEVAQAVATSRRSTGEVEVYVVGRTSGGSTGTGLDGNVQLGGYDIVLVKYDATGNKLWTRQTGTPGEDTASSVTSDGGGNVYVTGTVPVDLVTGASLGSNDVVLLKYDAAGTRVALRQLGSVNTADPTRRSDWGLGVAADRSRGVYVAGYAEGAIGTTTSAGDKDAVVVKYLEGCEVNTPGKCALGYGWGRATPPPAGWVHQFGNAVDQYAYATALSPLGGLYATGDTLGGLHGNTSAGGSDVFLVKYDTQGNRLWTRQFGTASDEQAYGLATDATGNLYIAGGTVGSFGGPNVGGFDAFLMKLDANGSVLWRRQLGSNAFDLAMAVAVGTDGKVYVTGFTYGGINGNTNAGNFLGDMFVSCYDSLGSHVWTRQLGTTQHEQAEAISIGADDLVYVAGTTEGSMDGTTQKGEADVFVVAVKAINGEVSWRRQLGSAGYDYAVGVAADGTGSVYVAGGTGAEFEGSPSAGADDLFLARIDRNGARSWSRTYGSTEPDVAGGLSRDAQGHLYLTGSTLGAMGSGSSSGGQDVVMLKLDAEGNPLKVQQLGTSADEHSESICVDDQGFMYTAGGTLGVFPGEVNAGGYDGILLRYAP